MYIWLLHSVFAWKTKETLEGFYKVVSLLKILYLNLVRWHQRLELYIKLQSIGDNVKLS